MNLRDSESAKLACGLTGEIVRTFGEVRLRVFGTSMVPSILPGDLISVQRAGISEISAGEIVLVLRSERLLVHRVVGWEGDPENATLVTRGDRLRSNDLPVSPEELLGRVFSVERGGRKIDFAVRRGVWMRAVIFLLQASRYATSAYLRIIKLSVVRGMDVTPQRKTAKSDGKLPAQRASACQL